ncbi:unnamed protein product [Allacma fusca]|uniref:Uncharacterized protein n=1 Tax=Allacma fusca TaxID=39272 RepID=A0A8J2KJQ3_9HEXA|nr:unnamed protein product [Allacma fusca]
MSQTSQQLNIEMDLIEEVHSPRSNDEEDRIHSVIFEEEEVQDEIAVSTPGRDENSTPRIESTQQAGRGLKRKTKNLDEEFLEIYKKRVDSEDPYHHFGVVVATKLRELAQTSTPAVSDCQLNILQLIRKAERSIGPNNCI